MLKNRNSQPAKKLTISVKEASINVLKYSFAVLTVSLGVTIQLQLSSIVNNYFFEENPPEGASVAEENPPEGASVAEEYPPEGASVVEENPPEGASVVEENPPEGASVAEEYPPEGASVVEENPPEGASVAEEYPPEGASVAEEYPIEPHQRSTLSRDDALQLIEEWIYSWPSVYGSPGSEEGLTAVKTFVHSNSPYSDYVLNELNGVDDLRKKKAFYSYDELSVKLVDYKEDVDSPAITVKLFGKYTYTKDSKPVNSGDLGHTTLFRLMQEDGNWRIYRSKKVI